MEKVSGERKANFDLLRIISAFSVILIHVNWRYFGKVYDTPSNSFDWIIGALINIVTRFSVPAFAMISGAFILQNGKNADLCGFYKKAMIKIFAPFGVALFCLVPVKMVMNSIMHKFILSELRGILTGCFFNLWYMYMLAGLYLMTPFLIKLKSLLDWRQYKTAAIIMMIWAVISQAFSSQKLSYSIGVVFAFLAYYLLGDVIRSESKKTGYILIFVISTLCIITAFLFRKSGYNYYTSNAFTNFFSPVIVIYSICVFKLFSQFHCCGNYAWLSKITFEIYLFHSAVLELGVIIGTKMNVKLESVYAELLLYIFTVIVSCCVAVAYKTIWRKILAKICNTKMGT